MTDNVVENNNPNGMEYSYRLYYNCSNNNFTNNTSVNNYLGFVLSDNSNDNVLHVNHVNNGFTGWVPVAYEVYEGLTPVLTVVEVWVSGVGHRVVGVSSLHTETFVKGVGLLSVVMFFATFLDSQDLP